MNLRVLIVDDSPTMRGVIRKTLMLTSLQINEPLQAGNGREGLDVLAREQVDLVIADINMPVMNGVEMIEKMSQDKLLDKVPVIVVSTDGSETRAEQLRAKGVLAFVHKPFTPELLRNVIVKTVGENHDN